MAIPKPRMRGAAKHCVFGHCNSDNRPSSRGYTPNMLFFSFPKPCLEMRRADIHNAVLVAQHIKECLVCDNCNKWVKSCKRLDKKFNSIAKITKDTYICEKHFVDHSQQPLPLPLPADQIIKLNLMNKRKRNSLDEKYTQNKIPKIEFVDCQEAANNSEEENTPQYHNLTVMKDAAVSTQVFTKAASTQTTFGFVDNMTLKLEIKELNHKIRRLKDKIDVLEKTPKKEKKTMSIFEEQIRKNEKMCLFYTGLVFPQILTLLRFASSESENIKYWGCAERKGEKRERARKFTQLQELILTLVRLRSGLLVEDLLYRFQMSGGLVTKIFRTWIQILFNKFNSIRTVMFPSREKIEENLPTSFSSLKNIRVIIDSAEILCETPSNTRYKAHTTFKILIGCTPNGAISFVSELFEEPISDREMVEKSNLLDLLEDGDMVIADRGFTIEDLTDKINVVLNIPPVSKGRKLTAEEELQTKLSAQCRTNVKHIIDRIKNYRLLQKIVPLNMRDILSQMVFVCACLINFQIPIINQDIDT